MNMISLLYVPTLSKSIMVSQTMHTIVFAFSCLRLHLKLSGTQKSASNSFLVFSQFNITVALPLVYVILAPMKPYLLAPSAKLTDINLMRRHHSLTFIIFSLFLDCMPWFQIHLMLKKCNTDQSINTILTRSPTYLIVHIIVYS